MCVRGFLSFCVTQHIATFETTQMIKAKGFCGHKRDGLPSDLFTFELFKMCGSFCLHLRVFRNRQG